MKLETLRKEIEQIDVEMMNLFVKRMAISKAIGQFKKENQLPIFDSKREKELIDKYLILMEDQTLKPYYQSFIQHIMDLSKDIQK
ncbi:MAG: chorismate mutase [Bacillota bacterium]|nr:MAG: chorismate mutase [Bacillota bacterium]